jgi:very-short-patch-repair endonuclease
LERLYATSGELGSDAEAEIEKTLPDPSRLPTHEEFEQFAATREALRSQSMEPNSSYWPNGPTATDPHAIEVAADSLRSAVEALPQHERWKMAIVAAGMRGGGYRQAWEDLIGLTSAAREESRGAQPLLVKYTPGLSSLMTLEEQIQAVREILSALRSGKKVRTIRLAFRPKWRRFIESVSLGEIRPSTIEHFEALEAALSLETTRAALGNRWDSQVASKRGPTSASFGAEIEHSLGLLLPTIQALLDWEQQRWTPARSRLADLGFSWDGFEREQPVPSGEAPELTRLLEYAGQPLFDAVQPMVALLHWERLEAQHQAWIQVLEAHQRRYGALSPSALAVYRALRALSPSAYVPSIRRLSELWASRSIRDQRQALLGRLSTAAPGWAAAISRRSPPHDQPHSPRDPEEAWLWRQLEQELKTRADKSIEDLQAEIDSTKDRIRSVTTELISCRAWARQAEKTFLDQRQGLMGWLKVVKKLGRWGTVKKAALLKRQAQENLVKARSAVPIWIMPTSRVVESFRPSGDKFDVAIVDEASQCDLTALVVLYLARTVIIVGDHEQVSPAAVGEDQSFVERLVHEYLEDVPNKALYDGRLSIYDLARQSFGEMVCLVEHFRSVPEIINFSNELAYEWHIKPLRESNSSAWRPTTVAYRVESSAIVGKLNRVEAMVAASIIVSACEQPEYSNATFGAISMVGEETAFEIDRILRLRIDPVEYQKRKMRCGNPAHFQGDERHVMVIAMVDVPEDGPRSLRSDDEWKKRFNVAASRPQDQLWVVHSLDPATDLKSGDLRRRLIEHARDPKALKIAVEMAAARAESPFETAVIKRLVAAGYRVRPQFPVGHYRIDIVVEGATSRLAIECDGDRYHPLETLDDDLARQEILERLGWRFSRIRGSAFFTDPDRAMNPVFEKLDALGIERLGPQGERDEAESSELVERVIRRAAELREQWASQEEDGTALSAAPGSARPSFWRVNANRVPDQEVEAASDQIVTALRNASRPLRACEGIRPGG